MDGPGFELRQGLRDLSLFKKVQTDPGAHPTSHSMGTGVLSRDNVTGASCLPLPCSANVQNECSHNSTSPVFLDYVNRDNIYYLLDG